MNSTGPELRKADEPKIRGSTDTIWSLAWRGCTALGLAMSAGVLVAMPVVYHTVVTRFKSYTETIYLVGNSPQNEARLTQWANSRPGIDKFVCERRDTDLWVRWEYRGFYQPEAVRNAPQHLREIGYVYLGERGIAIGAVPRDFSGLVGDVLTDSRTLTVVLLGSQASFGLAGLWLIRSANRKGHPLPPLFVGRYDRSLVVGAITGLGLFGFGSLYTAALKLWVGGTPPSPWNAVESMSSSARIVLLLFGAFGAPVAEEIFFRGYLFGMFKRADHVWAGILISAALFATAHFSDLYNVPAVFLYGVVLAWVFHRTQSLLSSMTGHTVNNALAIGSMLVR